jgi:hypothetical protein
MPRHPRPMRGDGLARGLAAQAEHPGGEGALIVGVDGEAAAAQLGGGEATAQAAVPGQAGVVGGVSERVAATISAPHRRSA